MTSALLLRVGALIVLIANVLIGFLFPDHNDVRAPLQPLYVPLNVASVIGVTMLLFGLPDWYARYRAQLARQGTIGLTLVVVTLLVAGVFIGVYEAVLVPAAAAQAPTVVTPGPEALTVVLLVGIAAEVVGPLPARRARQVWRRSGSPVPGVASDSCGTVPRVNLTFGRRAAWLA